MTITKLSLLVILFMICFEANAQRPERRSLNEAKQGMINTTVKLSEIRTYLNENTTKQITVRKTITFLKDSVVVITNNKKEVGIWLKNSIDFVITTAEGKQIKYTWLFGWENEPCFQVNNDKKAVECYQKSK